MNDAQKRVAEHIGHLTIENAQLLSIVEAQTKRIALLEAAAAETKKETSQAPPPPLANTAPKDEDESDPSLGPIMDYAKRPH